MFCFLLFHPDYHTITRLYDTSLRQLTDSVSLRNRRSVGFPDDPCRLGLSAGLASSWSVNTTFSVGGGTAGVNISGGSSTTGGMTTGGW